MQLTRVPGLAPADAPVRWSADGTRLFVVRTEGALAKIRSVDPATGDVAGTATISPPESAGVLGISDVMLARDGKQYSASYVRNLSTLEISRDLF